MLPTQKIWQHCIRDHTRRQSWNNLWDWEYSMENLYLILMLYNLKKKKNSVLPNDEFFTNILELRMKEYLTEKWKILLIWFCFYSILRNKQKCSCKYFQQCCHFKKIGNSASMIVSPEHKIFEIHYMRITTFEYSFWINWKYFPSVAKCRKIQHLLNYFSNKCNIFSTKCKERQF